MIQKQILFSAAITYNADMWDAQVLRTSKISRRNVQNRRIPGALNFSIFLCSETKADILAFNKLPGK